MSLSNTAISRVTGVDTAYKNFNVGRANFLPQRCAIIGQGNTASNSSYTTDKKVINNAIEDVADVYGYGSPLHLAALQFFPEIGKGIEGIPVTVYPLKDDGSGVVSDGSISVSGIATEAFSGSGYIGGVETDAFSIAVGAVPTTILASIKTAINSILKMPVIAGTVTETAEVLTLIVTAGCSSSGDLSIVINGAAPVTVAVLDTDDEVAEVATKIRNASFTGWTTGGSGATVTFTRDTMGATTGANTIDVASTGVTVTAGITKTAYYATLPLTAKWLGESGNDITIVITDLIVSGLTFSQVDMANGANNPDITAALNAIGNTWETFILVCLNYDDQDALDVCNLWGDARWTGTEKQPALCAFGSVDNYATRTAVTDAAANKVSKVNFLIQSTASRELPFVVAARHLVFDILPTANDNPPQNYKGRATGLHTGDDSLQENYTVRNNAIKLGASTNLKVGSNSEICDLVTMYHADSSVIQPYRYVVDIVKLMNIIYNIRLIFESDDWKGAPLLDDATPTVNPTAKQPKMAISVLKTLAKSLADAAIISDLEFTKNNITCTIDTQNPKRLNTVFPVKLSGNIEVHSIDIYFGFYLGS